MRPSRRAHWFHAVAFGGGIPFFAHHGGRSNLELLESRTFASQLVCLGYGSLDFAEAVLPTVC